MPSDFDVSRPRLIRDGSFLKRDWHEIARRRVPNRLGFAYQAAFVRVLGRFPHQEPEVLECISTGILLAPYNARRSMIRERCRAEILATGDDLVRPAPKKVGRHMTVAVWTGDWLAFNCDGLLSLEGTVANLRQAEQIIDAAARNL